MKGDSVRARGSLQVRGCLPVGSPYFGVDPGKNVYILGISGYNRNTEAKKQKYSTPKPRSNYAGQPRDYPTPQTTQGGVGILPGLRV